jgi:hypothetical protein
LKKTRNRVCSKGAYTVNLTTCFLDDATRDLAIREMGGLHLDDPLDALRRMAYLVPCGKRFSQADVVAVFGALGLSTDRVRTVLLDLARRRILESYPKDDTVLYYLERGARLDYANFIKRANGHSAASPVAATGAA